MPNISITISHKPMIGIVRHRPRPELIAEDGSTHFVPSTTPMQDVPFGIGKGKPIYIEQPIWDYLEAINSTKGYQYCKSVGKLWMNRTDGKAETVICGGNFVRWDAETDTHVRLVSYPVDYQTTRFNPLVDNWFYRPEFFWKACAIDGFGHIINVAEALDVWFMLVHGENRLWLNKQDIEPFPQPPAGMSYQVRGGDVFGLQNGKLTPVFVERQSLVSWFTLQTIGVVQPA